MKHFLFFVTAFLSICAGASNFIGIDADTIRINPNRLTGYWKVNVSASLEGYADTWQVSVTYPGGIIPKLVSGISALDGMTVPYVDQTGACRSYDAPLQVSAMYETLSSTTAGIYGYYDYNIDGIYETYGNIKWEPGMHRMWEFNLSIPGDFRSGYIVFDGTFNSGFDSRGPILSNVRFFKRTWLWVGYEYGDIGGDGNINIADVVLLIDSLLGEGLDEFQEKAADADRNGVVDISDATYMIDMILS